MLRLRDGDSRTDKRHIYVCWGKGGRLVNRPSENKRYYIHMYSPGASGSHPYILASNRCRGPHHHPPIDENKPKRLRDPAAAIGRARIGTPAV